MVNPMSKHRLAELAIFGGNPAFAQPLHVGRPNIGDRQVLLKRFNDMLDRRWLTNSGPLVREFEKRICEFAGVRNCVAMCNATIALEIAARALGMHGEVIVPSFTFVATAHAMQWQEITPVFADIDPATHSLDPAAVEKMITPRTTGIIGVHVWGNPCAVDALTEIARRRNLKLMFDAAHAFACSHRGKMIGNFGDAEVYSFHATKFLNTFEGGAVVTNDDALAAKIRLMTNFGFAGYDNVIYVGTNGKMCEPCAAMGLTGLDSVEEFISVNRRNYAAYRDGLADVAGAKLFRYDEAQKCNLQYVVVELDPATASLTRNELVEILFAENVLARRYFYPGVHHMEPYRSHFPHSGLLLPETEKLCDRVMILPTGTAVGPDEIAEVCQLIRLACAHPREVREQLAVRAGAAWAKGGT